MALTSEGDRMTDDWNEYKAFLFGLISGAAMGALGATVYWLGLLP